jgi:hypothetical protein
MPLPISQANNLRDGIHQSTLHSAPCLPLLPRVSGDVGQTIASQLRLLKTKLTHLTFLAVARTAPQFVDQYRCVFGVINWCND